MSTIASGATVLVREDGPAVRVTLNRPEKRNALSLELMEQLIATLRRVSGEPETRAIVLDANGPTFSAGHDLGEMVGRDAAFYEQLFDVCTVMMETIHRLPQPVIAKVHAMATAAGCQLVATCDLAVASTAATFATPGVNIGAFCSTPSVALGRTVARKHAMEMLLTGAPISAERAAQIGLVNRVVSPEQLDAEVDALAALIASKSATAIASGKQVFYQQLEMPLGDAYRVAGHAIAGDFFTEDGKEGVDAFLGKRAARWTSRG